MNDELEGEFKLTRISGETLGHYVGTGESSSDLAEVRIQSIRVCRPVQKELLHFGRYLGTRADCSAAGRLGKRPDP